MKKLIAIVALLLALPATAQAYPNQPIKMILGFAPGGPTDVIARVIAQDMAAIARPGRGGREQTGANSLIATQAVARAAPDGYTLLDHARAQREPRS